MTQNIKVLYLKNYNQNDLLRTTYILWNAIEEKLTKIGYKFQKYYSDDQNLTDHNWWEEITDKIDNGIYDIAIIPFCKYYRLTELSRKENINPSSPLFIEKPLIIFKSKYNTIQNYIRLINYLLKIWITFLFIFCVFSVIFYLIDIYLVKHKISFYDYFNSFLGANKNLGVDFKKAKLNLPYLSFIITICIFSAYLILNTLTVTISANYKFPNNSINRTLKYQRILIYKRSSSLIEVLKKSGANPVLFDYEGERMIKHYLHNKEYLDGFLIQPEVFKQYKFKGEQIFFSGINEGFNISNAHFTYSEKVYIINKERKIFYDDLNQILNELKENNLKPSENPSNLVKDICEGKKISNNYSNSGNILNWPCKI